MNIGNSSFNFTVQPNLESSSLDGQCRWSPLNTALSCFLAFILIVNIIAAMIIFRVPLISTRGRCNPVYLCIRFLSAIDIAQAVLLLAMPSFSDDHCNWIGGDESCKGWGFLALSLLLVSPLITIMMAFDRVVALYQPFKYRSNLGLQVLKFLLPIACAIVCIITALPIVGIGEYHVVRGRRMCLLDTIVDDPVDRGYVLVVHLLFLLSLFFMVGCTLAFQVQLCRLSAQKKFHTSSTRLRPKGHRSTMNATVTTMAICCIFVACYTPYVIRILVESSTGTKSRGWITWLTFGLAFTQPLVNPVVYLSTNAKYRQELMSIMRRIKHADIITSSDSYTMTSRAVNSERRRSSNYNCGRSNKTVQEAKKEKDALQTTSPFSTTRHVATLKKTGQTYLTTRPNY